MTPHAPANSPAARAAGGASRLSLNGALASSLLTVALAGGVFATGMGRVMSCVFAGNIRAGGADQVLGRLVVAHDLALEQSKHQFNGRSPFFPPPAKPIVGHKEIRPTLTATTSAPVGPPEHYTGPSVAWVIGDEVYFNMTVPTRSRKYLRLRVGEEGDGVRVLSIDSLPRTVHVAHAGGEYDVKVFGENMRSAPLFDTDTAPPAPLDELEPVGGMR